MPAIIKPLSAAEVSRAKPDVKDYKLRDGGGLTLKVTKSGSKRWVLEYSFEGKRSSIGLGVYPSVSLKDAREMRESYKQMITEGINPSENKKREKDSKKEDRTFKYIAERYFEKIEGELAESYFGRLKSGVVNNIYPFIGDKNINSVKRAELIEIIEKIQQRGAKEIAYRILNTVERIYKYAVTLELAEHNIVADIDKGAALKKPKQKHLPHIKDVDQLAQFFSDLEEYRGHGNVKYALKMIAHTFVRPYNIRFAEWGEFDVDNKIWKIPAEKMKMKKMHIVPLTDAVIEIYKELRPFNGHSKYLFPSPTSPSRPISENTINMGLKRMGYKGVTTPHGFRHTASTLLHENMSEHGYNTDVIELQMAHLVRGVRGIYNHAELLKERRGLMEWWSDFLYDLF